MSTDLIKLSHKLNECKKFFIFGAGNTPALLQAKAHKQSREASSSDLIVITERDVSTIINFLSNLSHSCDILLWNSDAVLTEKVVSFLDSNASKFQYSKQMLVKGVREKNLYIILSNASAHHVNNNPISIFLVLKTGGPVYDYRYVNATANNIRANLTHNAEIVCLTDDHKGIDSVDRVVKFNHSYPKWWGKVELFREDITKNQHCLFLDLDTVCLNSIDFLCKLNDGIYGLRDFYHLDTFQTGILKWTTGEDASNIYKKFITEDFSKYKDKGDHEWIGQMVSKKGYIQDEYPGRVVSYKKHLPSIVKGLIAPSIVCFHGDPRPHTVRHDFITSVWKY